MRGGRIAVVIFVCTPPERQVPDLNGTFPPSHEHGAPLPTLRAPRAPSAPPPPAPQLLSFLWSFVPKKVPRLALPWASHAHRTVLFGLPLGAGAGKAPPHGLGMCSPLPPLSLAFSYQRSPGLARLGPGMAIAAECSGRHVGLRMRMTFTSCISWYSISLLIESATTLLRRTHTPPPPLYKLRPCPSCSRHRDRINLGPNFNSVPNVVQQHRTWVW